MVTNNSPCCLSIAGFDPSAGAGVLADVKTFEQHEVCGFGVVSALTFQSEKSFVGLKWLGFDEIVEQISPLTHHSVKTVKIGLIQDFTLLQRLVNWLHEQWDDLFIVWDPVLKASAGFDFHSHKDFSQALQGIDLITPNAEEFKNLSKVLEKSNCAVLLKGGHRVDKPGIDTLLHNGNEVHFEGRPIQNKVDKHGTGCVLSSALAANVAKGISLIESCKLAKQYVEGLLQSNNTALGTHKGII